MGKFDFTSFGASLGEKILSTGVNWLLNQSNNNKQFSQAKELQQIAFQNQKDMFHMQNARQDQLNANQALTQRQSLQRAGINLNADVGFSPNVGVQTASAPNGSLPPLQPTLADFTGLYKAQQENQLMRAQADNLNEQTRAKRIQNDREEHVDNKFNAYLSELYNVDTDGVTALGKKPYKYNKGDYEFESIRKEIDAALANNKYNEEYDNFNTTVLQLKEKDPMVAKALADMPIKEREKLSNEIDILSKQYDILVVDKEIKDIEKDLKLNDKAMSDIARLEAENYSFANVVKSIKDPNLDWKDKLSMAFIFVAHALLTKAKLGK